MQLSAGLRFCGVTGNLQASVQSWERPVRRGHHGCKPPSEPTCARQNSPYSNEAFMGGTSLNLLATLCLRQPRRLLAFNAMRLARSWPTVNLMSNRIRRYFCAKLLSRWSTASLCWCTALFLPCAELCISLCWTSWDDCCWPASPSCQGPSEQHHNPLVYIVGSSKFHTIFICAEGALFPITQVSNEEVKQYWPLYWSLGCTAFPGDTMCESWCGDPSLVHLSVASWLEVRLEAVDCSI